MSAVAAMSPEQLPDDFGVREVRHPRRRFWGSGVLVGWAFWERYGTETVVRKLVYARQDEVDQGRPRGNWGRSSWVGRQ